MSIEHAPARFHRKKMKILSSPVAASRRHTSVIVRGDRREGEQMKRAIFFALMLVAILAPLASTANADLKSDEAIEQAP